jgi:hypothetical protein
MKASGALQVLSATAVVVLLGLLVISFRRCSEELSPCANKTLQEHPSPDGSKRAVVFRRDCGATTGFSTNVSVLNERAPLPNTSGNTFRANDPTLPDQPVVKVQWQSKFELVVSHRADATIAQKAARVSGVTVRFESFPSE